jgi:hypothetical protein
MDEPDNLKGGVAGDVGGQGLRDVTEFHAEFDRFPKRLRDLNNTGCAWKRHPVNKCAGP